MLFQSNVEKCWFLSTFSCTQLNISVVERQLLWSHHHNVVWELSCSDAECPTEPASSLIQLLRLQFHRKRTSFAGNIRWICFSHDASISAYQSPRPLEAGLQRMRDRKQKSKFTQLSLQSNFDWMSTECTIDVLFISINAVTAKGQIVSFRQTGLWAFVKGLQTQRQLRWLWEVVE